MNNPKNLIQILQSKFLVGLGWRSR